MPTATLEKAMAKAMLTGLIGSLRKALEETSPHVFAALTIAEMRLAQYTAHVEIEI